MSIIVAMGATTRADDWRVAVIAMIIGYFLAYPLYVILKRWKQSRNIKKQLVTSHYKLPVYLTPTEIAYIYSTKVKKQQIYATILDLANRSVLKFNKKGKLTTVDIGPKIEKNLQTYEKMLIEHVERAEDEIDIERLLDGFTDYKLPKNGSVRGSRQYVFWWLLRHSMQNNKVIKNRMAKKYVQMLLFFGVFCSFILVFVPLLLIRMYSTLNAGELDVSNISHSLVNSSMIWIILLIPSIITSFLLLRFRGRMLGRYWLLTPAYIRYLNQFDSFREYVRLAEKNKIRFESENLRNESIAKNRPYAIAFGFIKN